MGWLNISKRACCFARDGNEMWIWVIGEKWNKESVTAIGTRVWYGLEECDVESRVALSAYHNNIEPVFTPGARSMCGGIQVRALIRSTLYQKTKWQYVQIEVDFVAKQVGIGQRVMEYISKLQRPATL